MKRLVMVSILALPGCVQLQPLADQLRPLVEIQHVSHALQHVSDQSGRSVCAPSCGYNAVSVGIRVRPAIAPGLAIDLLEGYTREGLHGQKEVFTGRFTWEIGARQ